MSGSQLSPKLPGKFGQPVLPNLNVRQICPNCRSDPPNIIEEYSKGDLVCGDCGTILGDRIVDTRSEWRTFAGDESGGDPSRVGDAINPLLGNDFETSIGGDARGNTVAASLQRTAARANAMSNGKTSNTALSLAFRRIAEKCEVMQLTRNVTTAAQHIYKIADDKKAVRGKNELAVIAACIIFACRDAGVDRSFPEVCKAVRVTKKELGQVIMSVKTAIQGEFTGRKQTAGLANALTAVENLLSRFTNFLDLGMPILNAAKHISVEANAKSDIDGRSPVSIAAGVLYFTCVLFEKGTSAKDIARVAEVSDSTIKLICRMVSVKLDDVIRPEWKTQFPSGYASLAQLGRVNDNPNRSGRGGTPRRGGTPTPKPENGVSTPIGNGDASSNGASTPHSNGNGVEKTA